MVFRRDGFLFKLAYNWNIDWRITDNSKPQKTNILKLFLTVVFAVLCMWPLVVISRVFGWVVRIVGFLPALFLFGYRPLGSSWRLFESERLFPFAPISWWPKLDNRHVMPGVIIFFFFLGYKLSKNLIFLFGRELETTAGLWSLSAVLIFLIFTTYFGVINTERWQIVKTFIKTKKSKIPKMPIVEFK